MRLRHSWKFRPTWPASLISSSLLSPRLNLSRTSSRSPSPMPPTYRSGLNCLRCPANGKRQFLVCAANTMTLSPADTSSSTLSMHISSLLECLEPSSDLALASAISRTTLACSAYGPSPSGTSIVSSTSGMLHIRMNVSRNRSGCRSSPSRRWP